MIPYGRQDVTQADVDAVVDVLRSDFLTQGPQVPRFEQRLAQYCGASYVVAVNSATSALHIACAALGVGPGDWLWTTAITFVASSNCGLYCGADVDFVDIDPLTYNLSPAALADKLARAEREGKLPKVVVAVHMCGQSCDMVTIAELARRYNFRVIEDASHAIGAKYKGEPVGTCRYSDIAVFSFHPVKIVTTGEGGAAVTNDAALADLMELYRSHGITRDVAQMRAVPDGSWYYEQIVLGFNYRMTEVQAALGSSQLERLDAYVERRHALAANYDRELSSLPLKLPFQHADCYSAFHLYIVRLRLDSVSLAHAEIFASLREQGIGVNLHYIPVYRQPYYRERGYGEDDCPEAERYYAEAITLPLFPQLTDIDQCRVVEALKQTLRAS